MNISEVKKVKTAVIGCGMISNIYIHNLKNLFTIIDLVAVCDINEEAAKEKAATYSVDRIMTIDEIAESDEIELVVNLTAPGAHYSVIKRMLEAGKHVYTEKMFTTDIDQARELVALADSKGLMIGVSPDTVLGAGIQTAKNIIGCGLVGDITSGVVSINRNQNQNSEFYRFLQKNGGAIPYDVGIYYIGALIALLGSVRSVKAYGAPALKHEKQMLYINENPDEWTIPGNNVLVGTIEFENGALVNVHFDGNTAGDSKHMLYLFGTKGILSLGDPNEFNGFVKLNLPEAEECELPLTHGYNGKNMTDPFPFEFYGHRGIGAAELAWSIRLGRENRLSKEYGLHCMEVLIGMDKAAETGETYVMKSHCDVRPLGSGYFSSMFNGGMRADAERSLME